MKQIKRHFISQVSPGVRNKHVIEGVATFLTLPHLRGKKSQISFYGDFHLLDEVLEKFCTPSSNHKQALFACCRSKEDLRPPLFGIIQILLLGGDGEQGGDSALLSH